MMRRFITSGTLTWIAELDKGPNGRDTTLFPEGNTVIMVYGGHPPSGRHDMSNLGPRTPSRCSWGHGDSGV
jgi:hypothetical protein